MVFFCLLHVYNIIFQHHLALKNVVSFEIFQQLVAKLVKHRDVFTCLHVITTLVCTYENNNGLSYEQNS
jgi:hypothetical protein